MGELAKFVAPGMPNLNWEMREGLNLGGGEYVRFFDPGAKPFDSAAEILLIHNDRYHPEVFVDRHKAFGYCCHAYPNLEESIRDVGSLLLEKGIRCLIGTFP